jgi:hypothetical protein
MKRAITCLSAAAAITLAFMPGSAAADPPAGCPAATGLDHAVPHTATTPAGPRFFDLVRQICNH